jgi:tetratricopeptide (TPR) repeat protein
MTRDPAHGPATPSPFPSVPRPHPWIVGVLLVLATCLAYWRVGEAGFVNLDDDAYVEFQPMVNQGLRSAGLVWALTGSHSSNWHPLTTLSHMLDCELFGVKAAPMHWENVAWHALNSLLVFLVWRALTGATWRPAILAAVFALHPLHVESVAWISERKDLLSGFFWLLGLWAYAAYARQRTVARYVLVTAAMVLALLSKPMAVTFPCTLLLLDYWPLRRWPAESWRSLFVEKLPLFGLVAIHSVLTFLVQSASGAANYGERFAFAARIGNALVAYARYLGKTLWPERLSPMYLHPGSWPTGIVIGATILLAMITIFVWWQRRSRPWLLFGWLWFLGTLVPVIGIVQVGAQSMADRYMYLPILGLLTLGIWQLARVIYYWPQIRGPLIAATIAGLVMFGLVTARQVGAWRNSIALYQHSIAAGEDNAAVRYLLAVALQAAGRPQSEVVAQFQRALQLRPDYINAITQLAIIAISNGRMEEARTLVEKAARLEPNNPGMHSNLGALALRTGKVDEAIRHYETVLRLDPTSAGAHLELGQIFLNRNDMEAGRVHFEARARIDKWNADALADYGTLLTNMRRLEEARHYLERALWIRPNFPRARQNLDVTLQLLKENTGDRKQ